VRAVLSLFILGTQIVMYAQTASGPKALEYDRKAPLDIQQIGVTKRGDIEVQDISYASPKGGQVPAFLVLPPGKGPFAAVIWGHWYWGNSPARNRTEFLDEAVMLANSGVVSLLTDGPIARPGHVEAKDPMNEQQVADLIQQITDMERGADVLLARGDVDRNRLAYVGHSYNATVGAFVSGIDKRFKAFVLMAGGLSDEVDMKTKELQEFRRKVGAERFDAFQAKYAWLDPGKFVSHAAPATVFLQYATKEDFLTVARAKEYAAKVSEPKKFEVYEAPHALNAAARRDRVAFLVEQLKVKPPDAALVVAIPELYQPATQE
jgi:dienelactone hydrolase